MCESRIVYQQINTCLQVYHPHVIYDLLVSVSKLVYKHIMIYLQA